MATKMKSTFFAQNKLSRKNSRIVDLSDLTGLFCFAKKIIFLYSERIGLNFVA